MVGEVFCRRLAVAIILFPTVEQAVKAERLRNQRHMLPVRGLMAAFDMVEVATVLVSATVVRPTAFFGLARRLSCGAMSSEEILVVAVVVSLPTFVLAVVLRRLKKVASVEKPPAAIAALLVVRPEAMARVVSLAAGVPLAACGVVIKRRQRLTSAELDIVAAGKPA